MSFSCYHSDASSCPTTPSSQASTPSARTERENKDAYYALQNENELLRDELESLTEKLEDLERQMAASAMMGQQEKQKQIQSPKEWIRENLEEAQRLIDNIVGIKGITEDPLKAAIKMGISQPQPQYEHSVRYHEYQTQMPRVSISSSIVPSNEELYGY
jgi:dsDNA-specific endonuclease/ATPase MutS2